MKSCAYLLAIGHRRKVAKLICFAPLSTFQYIWYCIKVAEKQLLARVLNFSPIGTKEGTDRLIFKKASENRADPPLSAFLCSDWAEI